MYGYVANTFLWFTSPAWMFVLLVLLQLKLADIGVVRVEESTPGNQSMEMSELFGNLKVAETRFVDSLKDFESTKWVFVYSSDTGFSPLYLLRVLGKITAKRTVIGRFGCIPTEFVDPRMPFQKCHRYPILESGFAFTSDLISDFKPLTESFEYSVGFSFSGATLIDDFRFNFIAPSVTTDLNRYSISYPMNSSDLPAKLSHVTGISFPVFVSPYAKAQAVLGRNASFMDLTVATSDVVDVKCGGEQLQIPPIVYSKKPVVEIPCFDNHE